MAYCEMGKAVCRIFFPKAEKDIRLHWRQSGAVQIDIKELNVGSMAHSEGKVVVNKAISMDADDIRTFEELKKLGVSFDVRKVPSDSRENMDDLLKKAAAGLH